jgi:hypothetical protein
VESTDVHGSLIGHDIGVSTIMAPRALSGPYEAQPSSPFSTGLGTVGNGATHMRRASFAEFVNRSLDPGSGPNLFDQALRATAAAMTIDRTKEGHGGL